MKLKDAVRHFGSTTKLCKALSLNRMNSFYWGYWVPMKHAQHLSFEVEALEYDHALYSGSSVVKNKAGSFKASPEIASRQVLEKELRKNTDLFFYEGNDVFTKASDLPIQSLNAYFREYPIYTKVA